MEIAGLCRTDVYVAEGKIPTAEPLILGHEFSGVIRERGTQVKVLKEGDRVTVNPQLGCGQCPSLLGRGTPVLPLRRLSGRA